MEHIATIKEISNAVFYIKTQDKTFQANIGDTILRDTRIIPDTTNTNDSYMIIHQENENKDIIIKGNESILISDTLADESNQKNTQKIADNVFLEEIEKLEDTAAGDETSNNLNNQLSNILDYNSEFQLSSGYESINLQNLSNNTNLSPLLNSNNQSLNNDLAASVQSNNITEENINLDTVIAKIDITNLNNPNSDIIFSIRNSSTPNYYMINQNTGEITLTQEGINAINSDVGTALTQLDFSIEATDSSTNNSIQKDVSVNIARINDNPTIMTVDNITNVQEEAISTSTVVAKVDSTDLDGDNITYSIKQTNVSNYFSIDSNGVVSLTQSGVDAINADTPNSLTSLDFTVIATDGLHQTEKDVSFDIARVNDNPVIMTVDNLNTNVQEESVSTNTILANINSTDADGDDITYSIKQSNVSNYISIDSNGVIKLTQDGVDAINSDIGVDLTSLSFTIIASDDTHQTEQDISLDINRVNDNAPDINITTQNTLKEENIAVGDIIAILNSTDHDDNTNLNYSIASDSPNKDFFTLSQNGEIKITQEAITAINNDSQTEITSFDIKIQVSDGNFITSQDITVNVDREYDSIPQITMSSFAQVIQSSQAGDTVMAIKFSDLDDNDDITYSITSGNDNNYFEIDNDSDSIILTQTGQNNLLDILSNTQDLEIIGTDKGNNSIQNNISIKGLLSETFPNDNDNDGYLDGSVDDEEVLTNGSDPIDAKAGFDTLVLKNDTSIDLSGLAKNIEKVDLSVNGTHSINELTIDDVINSTDQSNELIIFGGFDDKVELKNEQNKEWQNDGTIVENGITYTQYSDARDSGDPTVVLKIAQDIDTQVI